MKKNYEQLLYIKTLYENTGKIISDKLFTRYLQYIDYNLIDRIITCNISYNYIFDPMYAFFDALCRKKIEIADSDFTSLYVIMSPYHKKDVIYGLLVDDNIFINAKPPNHSVCKDINLYTFNYTAHDTNYLKIAATLFKNSKKTQQEQP